MRRECRERFPRGLAIPTSLTHVPWCMLGTQTSVFLWNQWRRKRSRHTLCMRNQQFYVSGKRGLSVREITKSSDTFSATNINSNIVWLFQLHDTIQMKSNYTWINYNHLYSIYRAKGEKCLFFRLPFVDLQLAKDVTHMFDAKYRYVLVVQISWNRTLGITPH